MYLKTNPTPSSITGMVTWVSELAVASKIQMLVPVPDDVTNLAWWDRMAQVPLLITQTFPVGVVPNGPSIRKKSSYLRVGSGVGVGVGGTGTGVGVGVGGVGVGVGAGVPGVGEGVGVGVGTEGDGVTVGGEGAGAGEITGWAPMTPNPRLACC